MLFRAGFRHGYFWGFRLFTTKNTASHGSCTTYYDILGVKPSASMEDIKKSYFQQSKIFHPDVKPSSSKQKLKFQELQEAYSVLSTPNLRRSYDLSITNKEGQDFGEIYRQKAWEEARKRVAKYEIREEPKIDVSTQQKYKEMTQKRFFVTYFIIFSILTGAIFFVQYKRKYDYLTYTNQETILINPKKLTNVPLFRLNENNHPIYL